ncbi:hypothetical protein N7468_006970 [Penicillium chermesinum]|uniref:Uncharacterized protein n=1 Tax=Penicillium chermesinum TaxID=63820 RepID=A0A9W9NTD2_9EURO|nr:uncharacterized protein N7468_006970 [Penicillium chermesinum]KAJ5225745.1 hypothetical protein N7468_006970 [Penicillium chermesinum]
MPTWKRSLMWRYAMAIRCIELEMLGESGLSNLHAWCAATRLAGPWDQGAEVSYQRGNEQIESCFSEILSRRSGYTFNLSNVD